MSLNNIYLTTLKINEYFDLSKVSKEYYLQNVYSNIDSDIEKLEKEKQQIDKVKLFEKYRNLSDLNKIVLDAFINKIEIGKIDPLTSERPINIDWNLYSAQNLYLKVIWGINYILVPQGDAGIQGLQGEIGHTGPRGEKGDVGPAGPRGFPGEIGISEVITIDGTETVEPNEETQVQDDFDRNIHHLTFYIPKGEKGRCWTKM